MHLEVIQNYLYFPSQREKFTEPLMQLDVWSYHGNLNFQLTSIWNQLHLIFAPLDWFTETDFNKHITK